MPDTRPRQSANCTSTRRVIGSALDDVRLAEEGRPKLGAIDDYEVYLSEQGHAGEQFMHAMNNN